MQISSETPHEHDAIFMVTQAAFRDHPHSQQTEGYIVDALRQAGALALSLVARQDGRIAGHAAFSPVAISDGTPRWYGLGPVSVTPEFQRQGIGAALIREGLARLEAMGEGGCVVLGEPDYYARFGFAVQPGLTYPGVPPEYFMALAFAGSARGQVSYHPAFYASVNSSPS